MIIDREILSKEDALSRFLPHCQQKTYPAKHTLIKEGEQSGYFYYIIEGSVAVLTEDKSGREIILGYLNAGEFFGEMGLFDQNRNRSAFVRTKTRCKIARISYEKLKKIDSLFLMLLYSIASQMAMRLCKTNRKVSDLAFTDVKGRVAKALLELCKEPDAMTHPQGMQISVTRKELGLIVGSSREMAGRALKSLAADQLIAFSGKKNIIVLGAASISASGTRAIKPGHC